MIFKILSRYSTIPAARTNRVFLFDDDWNDWFEFQTMYHLTYVDENDVRHSIGSVKIGQFKMAAGQSRPSLERSFEQLSKDFFSVGQDDIYYENLNKLGDTIRDEILNGLRDLAKDAILFDKAIDEKVTKISLLRDVSPTSVKGQFRRLTQGGARLSRYEFTYKAGGNNKSSLPPISISFNVEPESNPPTNVHVLIGRNGVGKTYLLNNMISALIDPNLSASKVGQFETDKENPEFFSGLVSVTFSAFDENEPSPEIRDKTSALKYSYIGLKRYKKGEELVPPKSPTILKNEFVKSLIACRNNSNKTVRWKKAVEMLEADPIFQEAEMSAILDTKDNDKFEKNASYIFKNLSSGHKIVLLTISRLIETVEERTLVLIDEPEAHLHPPLLSAFIRALSDLLIHRNGVAFIATHSPVVLQEVPKSCVWKLRRTGSESIVERLEIESFGENVGVLTREIFGLEVTNSGFHKLLLDAMKDENNYETILSNFKEELGMEARAILKTLLYSKNPD